VIVVTPRWDSELKNPENVAVTILDILAVPQFTIAITVKITS